MYRADPCDPSHARCDPPAQLQLCAGGVLGEPLPLLAAGGPQSDLLPLAAEINFLAALPPAAVDARARVRAAAAAAEAEEEAGEGGFVLDELLLDLGVLLDAAAEPVASPFPMARVAALGHYLLSYVSACELRGTLAALRPLLQSLLGTARKRRSAGALAAAAAGGSGSGSGAAAAPARSTGGVQGLLWASLKYGAGLRRAGGTPEEDAAFQAFAAPIVFAHGHVM